MGGIAANRLGAVKRKPSFGRSTVPPKDRAFGATRLKPGEADIKPWVIGIISATPDDDQVALRTHQMAMRARCLPSNPLALPRSCGDAAIKRRRELKRYKRAAFAVLHQPASH